MQSEAQAEPSPEPAQTPGFMEELRAFGAAIPQKGVFAGLALAWTALFHFYGNPTLGYFNKPSLFGWLENSYSQSADDTLGMYIPLIVLGLLWWKRAELSSVPKRTWWPALALFILGLLLHVLGYTVQQTRLSVVGYFFGLYGIIGLLWGWRMMRAVFFPFFLFSFMMPLTSELEGLTLPLRYAATKVTVILSHIGGIDVVQKGTLIESTGGHFSYNVEVACSGLRSLTTMLMLGCIFGFTAFQSNWKRIVLIGSAFPLAVLGNVIRLLGIVIASSWKYDQMIADKHPVAAAHQAAQALGSYVHDHSVFKLVPYIPAFIGMMLLARWLREDAPEKAPATTPAAGGFLTRPAWIAGAVVMLFTASAMGFLATQHSRQTLGKPGLRIEDKPMYALDSGASTNPPVEIATNRVYLPERVLDFHSQLAPVPTITYDGLPKDTVFGHRIYGQSNGMVLDMQVVLMGADRSSIHKPQYCLNASGFNIVSTEPDSVRIEQPHAYDLPIMKLKLRREFRDPEAGLQTQAGVFVYWFIADGELTAQHHQRMWWMARDMLKTGVLQRWAYVICFAPCAPGGEEAAMEGLKRFIAAAVPEFQITHGPREGGPGGKR